MTNKPLKPKPMKMLQVGMLAVAISALSIQVSAQTVDSALNAASAKITKAAASQARIDKVADETDKLFNEFQVVSKQLENVRVYNAQLNLQIKDQTTNMAKLRNSIQQAATMEREMAPLVEEMIVGLAQFIELDMPFHTEIRQEAVAKLEDNQSNSNLSAAERFRQILETYRIEGDYGKNIESYTKTLNINGTDLDVNILRVGRVALMYQSEDQSLNGVWNNQTKTWDELNISYRKPLADLYKMANKQASINIMKLPISAPQEAN